MNSKTIKKQMMKSLRVLLKKRKINKKEIEPHIACHLLSQGLAHQQGDEIWPSQNAKQALKRFMLEQEQEAANAFQGQHQMHQRQAEPIPCPSREQRASLPFVNLSESPLLMMANRKNAKGQKLLTITQLQAGERLRRDFEKGQCNPAMGINWQRLGQGGLDSRSVRSDNEAETMSSTALEARRHWRAALEAVGEEFAGPLIDLCCFLKGLEQIEKQRQWPSRSAKLILSLGLNALARHYGLQEKAIGPNTNAMRQWGDKDYRPIIKP